MQKNYRQALKDLVETQDRSLSFSLSFSIIQHYFFTPVSLPTNIFSASFSWDSRLSISHLSLIFLPSQFGFPVVVLAAPELSR